MAETPNSSESLLDAEGRVALDVACVECGYNVRTLEQVGRCPECGHPVRNTCHAWHATRPETLWMRRVLNRFESLHALAAVVFVMALNVLLVTLAAPTFAVCAGFPMLPIAFGILFSLGPLCTDPSAGAPKTLRRLLRLFSAIWLSSFVLAIVFACGGLNEFSFGCVGVSLTSFFVLPPLMLKRMREIELRLGTPASRDRFDLSFTTLAIATSVTWALLGIVLLRARHSAVFSDTWLEVLVLIGTATGVVAVLAFLLAVSGMRDRMRLVAPEKKNAQRPADSP